MRLVAFVFGMCLTVCGSIADAGFLGGYTGTTTTVGAGGGAGRRVQYTVWENKTGSASGVTGLTGSPTVAAGSFAYLYQVTRLAGALAGIVDVNATSAVVGSVGSVAGQSFVGATAFASDSSTRAVTAVENTTFSRFTLTPASNNAGFESDIFYIISTYAPTFGTLDVYAAGLTAKGTSSVPVPVVPLPASLALFAFGLPFAGSFRRRFAR